eukprot:1139334-Pelagomonas_calceolata.AAC.11
MYAGLENKSGKKIPNKFGAFEVLRSFTAQEQVGEHDGMMGDWMHGRMDGTMSGWLNGCTRG